MIKEENGRYIVSLKIKGIPVIINDYTTKQQAIQAEKVSVQNKKFFVNLKQFRFLVAHNMKKYKPTQRSRDGLYRPRLHVYSKLLGKRSVVLGKYLSQEDSRQAVYDYLYRGRIPKSKKEEKRSKDIISTTDTNTIDARNSVSDKVVDNSLIFKLMDFLNSIFFFMR